MRKLSKFFIKTLVKYAALHSKTARLNGKVGQATKFQVSTRPASRSDGK
jgi:hypothetical protein